VLNAVVHSGAHAVVINAGLSSSWRSAMGRMEKELNCLLGYAFFLVLSEVPEDVFLKEYYTVSAASRFPQGKLPKLTW
jgi:hypothetical protein